MDCSLPGSSVHGDSPGKNTVVGCHALLQGIFPTQGSNLGLLHCRRILYHLSHQGSPWILEWVAMPFLRGSSQPRNWTGVSCIAGGFFASWATRKEPTPVFLPRESPWREDPDGLQSIPRGCWEILTTTLMHHHKAIYRELRSYSYLQDLQTF